MLWRSAYQYGLHKLEILKKKSINHELVDNELDENDLVKIFDKVVSLYDWYKFIPKAHRRTSSAHTIY